MSASHRHGCCRSHSFIEPLSSNKVPLFLHCRSATLPIRDCVDRESREKEKIHSDLEKAEKLKNQLAAEVDEHHSAIEHKNNLNLR